MVCLVYFGPKLSIFWGGKCGLLVVGPNQIDLMCHGHFNPGSRPGWQVKIIKPQNSHETPQKFTSANMLCSRGGTTGAVQLRQLAFD